MSVNPFRPGTKSVPPLLAGREHVIQPVETALAAHGNNYGSFFAVYGPRGLGKTSVLHAIHTRAEAAGWESVSHEVRRGEPVLRPLLDQLAEINGLPKRIAAKLATTRAAWSEQEQTIDLKLYRRTARRAPIALPITDQFVDTVQEVVEHLSDRASGLVLSVDEILYADPGELSILGPMVQELSARADQSVIVALAGLSAVPNHLSKAFTYSERWRFYPLENLSTGDAALALALPAQAAGKPFSVEAVDLAADISGGYPFAVQLIGFNAWNSADSSSITAADVQAGHALFTEQLSSGLYAQRWNDLSPLSKAYVAAAAFASTTPARADEICEALDRNLSQLSSTRAVLLGAGTITSTSTGTVQEAIPGFFDYVQSQPDSQEAIVTARSGSPNTPPADD